MRSNIYFNKSRTRANSAKKFQNNNFNSFGIKPPNIIISSQKQKIRLGSSKKNMKYPTNIPIKNNKNLNNKTFNSNLNNIIAASTNPINNQIFSCPKIGNLFKKSIKSKIVKKKKHDFYERNNNKEMPIKLKVNLKQNNNNNIIQKPRLRAFSSSSFRKNKIFDDKIIKMCANGLINIGATCYMNATLQCLAHVQNLTKYLLKMHKNSYNSNKYMLTNAYREVIYNLWENKNIRDYSPDNFKKVISKIDPLFAGIQANDSKDLIIFLMENLHKELNEPEKNFIETPNFIDQYNYKQTFNNFFKYFSRNFNSIISHLFYGMYNSMMQCLNCNIITNNIQCFNILIFPLEEVRIFKNRFQNVVNIYECFEYYQKTDSLEGSNQIFCNNCQSHANSMNTTKLIICPNILVINLNRGKGLQYDIKLVFDEYINIKNFVFYAQSPSSYELIGIVTHFGPSSMSGHFIAFCKSFHDGKWYKYNDSIVTMSSFEEARITGVPYILFYSYIKV